jgi:hypothetical protein
VSYCWRLSDVDYVHLLYVGYLKKRESGRLFKDNRRYVVALTFTVGVGSFLKT